ncbi:putative zinc knuckle domain protein [Erysiphe necator]|uniref:Putative zinc knuckle domain protein n=1 Tax=Uncinula necator TaxID=52586 RepID=A0A0B1PCV4_UNCNE|nr:putative zinc knuckle domain protein [Erysiphe necator]
MTTERNMELILPEGMITWQSRGSQSTLDLAFISKQLLGTVIRCQPSAELESSSDYIPVITELLINPPQKPETKPKPQWKKACWDAPNFKIATKLSELSTRELHLSTPEAIDQRVAEVTQVIQESIKELVPKPAPTGFSKPYWTLKCSQAVKRARRARRRWTDVGNEESWAAYCKVTNSKKNQIRKEKQIGWRATVTEATKDPHKIWKLTKWARKHPYEKHNTPQIPETIDKNDTIHSNSKDKATAMTSHFSPHPRPADTSDIDEYEYRREIEDIPQTVLSSELEEALTRHAEGKAPGLDQIPGTLLKHCRTALTKELTKIFNACLLQGYHPRKFKESITIVLSEIPEAKLQRPKLVPSHSAAEHYREASRKIDSQPTRDCCRIP